MCVFMRTRETEKDRRRRHDSTRVRGGKKAVEGRQKLEKCQETEWGKKRGSMCVISREAMVKDGVSLCVCVKKRRVEGSQLGSDCHSTT